MVKWEALAVIAVALGLFGAVAITEYSREKTEQYNTRYSITVLLNNKGG